MPKACAHALPVLLLNVPALAARSEAEVAAHLGTPDPGTVSVEPTRPKHCYRNGKIEVIFVEGKATWLKVYGSGDLPFAPEALSKLGLSIRRPTYVNPGHVMSWHNLPRLREVSLYGGGPQGSVSSVVICVQTTPGPASRRPHQPRISFPRLFTTRR